MVNADGGSAVRLSDFRGPVIGVPNWSPDGRWLTFHARPEGHADIFVMPSAGGPVRRITTDPEDETMPSFSHDGRSIYYGAVRNGRAEIWNIPLEGGNPKQLTADGGQRPVPSPDGKTVFYVTSQGDQIRAMPAGGGHWTTVVSRLHSYPTGFTLSGDDFYYVAPPHSGQESFLMSLNVRTGRSRPVAIAQYPFQLGLSVSPDKRHILYDQVDQVDRDLLVVKDFLPRASAH